MFVLKLFCILVFLSPTSHALFDWNFTSWNSILQRYVHSGEKNGVQLNLVNYTGIQGDSEWNQMLAEIPTWNIQNLTKNETYALFINIYNIFAVNMIIRNPCEVDPFGDCGTLLSITDIDKTIGIIPGRVWKDPAGVLGSKTWSLDDVEALLRNPTPYSEDPRLHSAIVCASVSCPNLRNSAFTVANIDQKLNESLLDFLNNTQKGMSLNTNTKTLTLSKIFDWYSSDFTHFANGTVLDFILLYWPRSSSEWQFISKFKDDISIDYFSYDWSVNADQLPCHSTRDVCYPMWALLLTCFGVVVILIVVIVCTVRWRLALKKRSVYTRV